MSDSYGSETRPDDIPEAVWNSCWWAQAGRVQMVAARAIMSAISDEREAIIKMLEEGYDRVPGVSYRDDGAYSKNDKCLHGHYMWEDCEPCAIAAIRSR